MKYCAKQNQDKLKYSGIAYEELRQDYAKGLKLLGR